MYSGSGKAKTKSYGTVRFLRFRFHNNENRARITTVWTLYPYSFISNNTKAEKNLCAFALCQCCGAGTGTVGTVTF
jgi:hypothetical protein